MSHHHVRAGLGAVLGLGLCLLAPGAALGSAPVPAAPAAAEAGVDADAERAVGKMGESCSVWLESRAPRVRRDCPAKMAAVARLGDRAVPALVARVKEYAASEKKPWDANRRTEVMVAMLEKNDSRQALAALYELMASTEVQRSRGLAFGALHRALKNRTGVKLDGSTGSQKERAALAQKWLAYRDTQQTAGNS